MIRGIRELVRSGGCGGMELKGMVHLFGDKEECGSVGEVSFIGAG